LEDIYRRLAAAVVAMQIDKVYQLAQEVLEKGYPPEEAIQQGLTTGMNEVGRLFAAKKYFVPEVLVCAKAMYAGFDILREKVVEGKIASKGTIVIGVVDGDYHDIGKNIVKLMLESSGFSIIDLGKNVTLEDFSTTVADKNPAIVALSTLMTTTMDSMAEIVISLKENHPDLKLMVGGASVNSDFARSVGAHFYGENASEAVEGAHHLVGISFEN